MLINKYSFNIPRLFFIISFILLIMALMGTEYYCYKKSKTLYTYNHSHDQLDPTIDDIFLNVTVSKQWDDSDITLDKPAPNMMVGYLISLIILLKIVRLI